MPNREDFIEEIKGQVEQYFDEHMPDCETPFTITVNHGKYPTQLVVSFREEANESLIQSTVIE